MSTALSGSDLVGRLIDGRFPLLRRLGGTERSAVFLTELEGDQAQKAAIKLIAADLVDAEALIAHWAVSKTLSHPHLMRLFHAGRCNVDGEDLLYAVTEYAEEILGEILPERPLTPEETRAMLAPVLDVLSYLHGRDLVHGHLKPSNIMVVDDQLKLSVDRLYTAGELSRRSPSAGGCDAPESAEGKEMSPAADVWSLGVVVVESLTQQRPAWDVLRGGDPDVPTSIPQPLFRIARECLCLDPVRRCTLSSIKAYLEPARSAEPVSKNIAKGPSQARMGILTGAALAVIILIAVLAIALHHTTSSPPSETQSSAPAAPIDTTKPQSPAPAPATAPQAPVLNGSVVKGVVSHQVMPDVPSQAVGTIRGSFKVGIRVQADTDGNVSSAMIDSLGPSRYFANFALQAAEDWKFIPAQVDGHPVASTWTLQFEFARTGTVVTPVETAP